MAALLVLMVVVVLVAGGVFANMYLYAHGAFGRRKQLSGPLDGQLEAEERRYYASVGVEDDSTERYLRRVVSVFLIGVLLLIVVLVLFLQSTF